LALAQFADEVASLPFGLDTWIGQAGIALSGGQARRLSIARALMRHAPVLILDEPGEGLDRAAHAQLLAGVLQASTDLTVILVTHSEIGLDLMDEIVTLSAAPH
jgi:ATP-binding cassette subfamily C protein CydC